MSIGTPALIGNVTVPAWRPGPAPTGQGVEHYPGDWEGLQAEIPAEGRITSDGDDSTQ